MEDDLSAAGGGDDSSQADQEDAPPAKKKNKGGRKSKRTETKSEEMKRKREEAANLVKSGFAYQNWGNASNMLARAPIIMKAITFEAIVTTLKRVDGDGSYSSPHRDWTLFEAISTKVRFKTQTFMTKDSLLVTSE
jgi:hypothetical protein